MILAVDVLWEGVPGLGLRRGLNVLLRRWITRLCITYMIQPNFLQPIQLYEVRRARDLRRYLR